MAASLTKEQFINKAESIHGNKYSYEKTIYVNMRKPITIICKKHGEFKQSPMNHLKTEGCPKCGYENRTTKKVYEEPVKETVEEPIEKLSEDDMILNIVKKYSEKVLSVHSTVNPFSNIVYEQNKHPVAKDLMQSNIILTDEMLEVAYNSGVIAYEEIDQVQFDMLAEENLYSTTSHNVNLIKKVVVVDWNSIALNKSLTFNQLYKYRTKISLDYLVHSPAFIAYSISNEISEKSKLLTIDDINEISKKYQDSLQLFKLADDWFDSEENAEFLYSAYLIPKLVNRGIVLTPKILSKFKSRMIPFIIDFIMNKVDSRTIYKMGSILKSITEDMFMIIYDGISFSLLKNEYLKLYMEKHYVSDSSLEILINFNNIPNIMNLISSTQVPSIKFIRKYRESLDPILIIRSMLKNNRLFTSYIEEFIDELIIYNKTRSEIFKENTCIQFTGGDTYSNQYIMDRNEYSTENMIPPPMFTGSISYTDGRMGYTSTKFEYYKEDVLKAVYSKTKSKLFKKLYEALRFDNGKNNEMVASIQSELETLLNNSKQLQEKLNKFKKSI